MYVYIRSEPGLRTVGQYWDNGKFEPESDHDDPEAAAREVHNLNADLLAREEVSPAWISKKTEPTLWTVGFHKPDGKWEPESDHGSPAEANRRAGWLNGY